MKLYKYIIILLLTVGVQRTHAQVNFDDSTVSIITWWPDTDTAYYTKWHSVVQVLGNDTIRKVENEYLIRLVILDRNDISYHIEWTYFLLNDSLRNDTLVYFYDHLFSLDYTIDSLGIFKEANMMDMNMKSMYLDQKLAHRKLVSNEEKLKWGDVFTNTTYMMNTLFEDISEYHRYFGYRYKMDSVYTFEFESVIENQYITQIGSIDQMRIYEADTSGIYYIFSEEKYSDKDLQTHIASVLRRAKANIKDRAVYLSMFDKPVLQKRRDMIYNDAGWLLQGIIVKELQNELYKSIYTTAYKIFSPEEEDDGGL